MTGPAGGAALALWPFAPSERPPKMSLVPAVLLCRVGCAVLSPPKRSPAGAPDEAAWDSDGAESAHGQTSQTYKLQELLWGLAPQLGGLILQLADMTLHALIAQERDPQLREDTGSYIS